MQEEGEVPSEQFLEHLGNHLISKKRDVPFVVPNEKPQKIKTDTVKNIARIQTPQKPKEDVSKIIEASVHDGQLTQAMDIAMKSIKNGAIPKSNVLKYALKNLAQKGNVEKIQEFGMNLTEGMKRKVTFDDKLTLAIFMRGAGRQHIEGLIEAVQVAKSNEELEVALRKFPRSAALASIMEDDELSAKCKYTTNKFNNSREVNLILKSNPNASA